MVSAFLIGEWKYDFEFIFKSTKLYLNSIILIKKNLKHTI